MHKLEYVGNNCFKNARSYTYLLRNPKLYYQSATWRSCGRFQDNVVERALLCIFRILRGHKLNKSTNPLMPHTPCIYYRCAAQVFAHNDTLGN